MSFNLGQICDKLPDGHVTIGPITIYGRNAMHWGVDIESKKYGFICFRLPFTCFGKWWPLYFYVSPDATPGKSTFYWSTKDPDHEKEKSVLRRHVLGHNFKSNHLVHLDEITVTADVFCEGVRNTPVEYLKKNEVFIIP